MSPLVPGLLAALAAWLVTARPAPSRLRAARATSRTAVSPDRWMPVLAAVGAGGAVALFVGGARGFLLGTVAAAGALLWVRRLESPAARRRRERLEADLPHAVDLLSACLAAGCAPGQAVAEVAAAVGGPLSAELALVAARLRLGADAGDVWRGLAGDPQLGRLGRTLGRVADSGASVADVTTRLAEDLRREGRARVEARARAVGVKAALPLGVCLLPAFVLVGVVPLVVGSLATLL